MSKQNKNFLWACQHNRLPTRAYLNHLGRSDVNLCHLCNELETTMHIFLKCKISKGLWQELGINSTIDSIASWDNPQWLPQLYIIPFKIKGLAWEKAFPFYLWHIWLTRNDNTHNSKRAHAKSSTPYVLAMEYKHLTNCKTIRKTVPTFTKWKPPSKRYKLYIDGSTKIDTNCSGYGGIIRDTNGNWVIGFMGNSRTNDILVAELYAL